MMAAEHTHARRRTRKRPPRSELHSPADFERCVETAQKTRMCLWPGCVRTRASWVSSDYGDVPLCVGHLYETWRIARDVATARNDRTPTAEWPIDGKMRAVEKPVSLSGWIYYLRIDEHIKIGYAGRLEQRLRQYPPTAVLLAAHRGTRSDEKTIHDRLRWHRAAGREWYEPAPEVLNYIERVVSRYGEPRDPRGPRQNPTPRPTGDAPMRIRARSGRR